MTIRPQYHNTGATPFFDLTGLSNPDLTMCFEHG